MKTKLILDTSIFVNPASAHAFGSAPTEAVTGFLTLAKETEGLEFLMPPSIYSELMFFAAEKDIPAALKTLLQQIPPKKHELRIPGFFIYQLVESMRDRVDRGLRAAERHVREAFAAPKEIKTPGTPVERGTVRPDAEAISRLRETYRRIMREGMLDSKADVDLLLLAYETGGVLCSADMGVLEWAENLGVRVQPHDQLRPFLEEHRRKKGV